MHNGQVNIFLAILYVTMVVGYVPKRATLRPPKPNRKTPKGPILHRREKAKESNQLRDELIMKYWRRVGKEVNEVPFTDQSHQQHIDTRRAFMSMYVLPKMAEISYKECDILKLDEKKSSNFTRHSCLQFLCEIRNFFSVCAHGFNKNEGLKELVEMGPINEIPYLSNDITYIRKLINGSGEFTTEHGKYIDFLQKIAENDPIALVSHAYYFYKEWCLCKFHVLNSIKLHLRITRHFQSAGFNEDVLNFEYVLNMLACSWSQVEKDNFLRNLSIASDMAKCYTQCFT